jgi:hypothetical protein
MKKRILFLSFFAFIATTGFAQEDKAITEKLEQKYGFVVYHDTNGGWYSIRNGDSGCKACEGACDLKGNEIIPPIYDYVTFGGDYADVKLNGKYGIVDKHGNEIVAPKYDNISAHQFKENDYIRIKLNGKVGVIDKQGNEIVVPKYDYVGTYPFKKYDYAEIKLNGKVGVVDKHGNEIVAPKYDEVIGYPFKENDYAEIKLNGKVGLVDKQGNEIAAPKYDKVSAYQFKEHDYAKIELNGKYGLVDKQGNEIVAPKYDKLYNFSEGLAGFNVGGKCGYIDETGKEIIPAQYDTAGPFKDGAAQVSLNGQTTLIENPLAKGKANIGGQSAGFSADVDVNIPVSTARSEETFAFIFANESYLNFSVPFANNDGRIFKEYCAKTLGVPENNIRFYENATFGNMASAVNKIKEIADAYDGDARIIVYFSGQGLTDDNSKTPYLLPVDAVLTNLSATGYSLEKLNRELSEVSAKSALLIVDACFNGSDREGKMLTASRGVAVKAKPNRADGSLIVLSATSNDETAYQYKDKNHGLFTYYLLKKLQEAKGDISYKALTDYVTAEVKRQSVSNEKVQSPSVTVSDKLIDWQHLKIK